MMTENRENPALSRHYENNVVNIGQHYFHNVYIRFAHIHIMKIMVTDIHDIFPQKIIQFIHRTHPEYVKTSTDPIQTPSNPKVTNMDPILTYMDTPSNIRARVSSKSVKVP